MKYFIIILITLFCQTSFGQYFEKNITIDTLSTILLQNIYTREIEIELEEGVLYFNKESLVEVWSNYLALLDDELSKKDLVKDWQKENFQKLENYLGYLSRQDKIIFKLDQFQYSNGNFSTNDTLSLIINPLKEIACELIDLGEFELCINDNYISKVIKARVTRTSNSSETIATEYICNDSIFFWLCPPIVHSDFDIID